MDIATIGIEVDSRRLRAGTTELGRFTRSGQAAEVQTRKLSTATSEMARMARGAAGALAAAFGAREILRSAESYTRMTNSLRALGMESTQAAAALDQIAGIAQRTRAPLEATAQLYQRISIAGRDLGASSTDIARFTENVGLALAQTGTSATEASGALLQLSQAMAGGVVRAEEFNSILEGAYPIALAAAQGIDEAGGSVGRLRALVVDGKISSDEFFSAILSQTDQLQAAFAATTPTISQAFGVLRDQFTMTTGAMDQALGVTTALANGILFLADHVDRLIVYAGTAAVAYGTTYAIAMGVAAARTITLAGALVTLRAALVRTGIGALVVLAGEAVYQMANVSKEVGGVGEALGLLGDVARAVWTGIIDSAKAIPVGLEGVWQSVRAGFSGMVADLLWSWRGFVQGVANSAAGLADIEILGLRPFEGLSTAIQGVANNVATASNDMLASSNEASAAAQNAYATVGNTVRNAFTGVSTAVDALKAATDGATDDMDGGAGAADRLSEALAGGGSGGGGGGGAAGAASEAAKALETLKDEIEQLEFDANPVAKYRAELSKLDEMATAGLSAGAYAHAVEQLNAELASTVPMVDDVAGAFGDWMARGFQDFKSFTSSILQSFQSMLSDMVAAAIRNKIVVPVALGGGAGAGASGLLGAFGDGGSILGMGGLGGGAGFLGGLGNALSGGLGNLFNVGANAGGGGLMTTLGAATPIIAGVAVAFAALRKKTELLDKGFEVSVDGLRTTVDEFRKERTSRFFGLVSNTGTDRSAAGSDIADPITEAVAKLQESVLSAAATLNVGSGAFADFSAQIKISTKDMTEEQALAEIQRQIEGIGDQFAGMIPGLKQWAIEGEGATATLDRIVTSLAAVNSAALLTGQRLQAMSVQGAGLSSATVDAAGGLSAFQSAASSFASNFLSDAERLDGQTRQLGAAFGQLGLSLPRTRAEFRQLLEGIDTTTVSGAKLYGQVISLADAFAQATPAIANMSRELEGLLGTVKTDLDVALSGVGEQARANRQAAQDWYRASGNMRDLITDMRGTAGALVSGEQARSFSEMRYQTLLASAKAGDDGAAADLPAAARALLKATEATAASRLDMARAEARVMSDLQLAAGVGDVEGARHDVMATLQERQVGILETIRDTLAAGGSIDGKQLAAWRGALGSLDGAIKAVESITYADIQARLDVVATARGVPSWLSHALGSAAEGIRADVEFLVRAENLTPELRWIALTGASTHLSTVEFVARNRMPEALAKLALGKAETVAQRIRAVIADDTDPDALRVALLTATAKQRVIGVELAARFDGETPRGIRELAALVKQGKGFLTLGGGFKFDPSTAFGSALDAGVKAPINALMGSLGALQNAVMADTARREKEQATARVLDTVASANTTGPDGTLFLNANQTRNLAKQLGMDAAADLDTLRAQIAGASGLDMIRKVLSSSELKGALIDYALNNSLSINDAEYKRLFGDTGKLSTAEHFDQIGRGKLASVDRNATLGLEKVFDFSSIFGNIGKTAPSSSSLGVGADAFAPLKAVPTAPQVTAANAERDRKIEEDNKALRAEVASLRELTRDQMGRLIVEMTKVRQATDRDIYEKYDREVAA